MCRRKLRIMMGSSKINCNEKLQFCEREIKIKRDRIWTGKFTVGPIHNKATENCTGKEEKQIKCSSGKTKLTETRKGVSESEVLHQSYRWHNLENIKQT